MDFEETVVLCELVRLRRKRKRREYWVHPLWSDRLLRGKFYTMYYKLREHPKNFFRYFRMSVKNFDELLRTLGPALIYENTNLRLSVPAAERLAVTLRYLATGASFYSISFEYLLGATTVREIVKSTCTAIWNLHPLYMPEKSEEDWLIISNQFYQRTNVPNIIGAIDGKHIRMIKPENTDSQCFNYKKYFSTSPSTQNVNIREDDIDNDVLIEEVEKRPALYDKSLKEYSDINVKIKAWEEISRTIFSNAWGNLSQQQKTEVGKLVQKRWKNLRACFSRELREQKSTKSGQAAKKRRKYKHFDQLLFLVSSMDTRETSGNAEDIDCEEDSRDDDEDVPQRSQYPRKKKSNTMFYEERLLDILDKKRVDDNKFIEAVRNNKSNCDDDDREKHFALSLVPLLKAVPEENKLEVQIKILQIFQDVQKQNSYSTQRNSSPMYSSSTSYIESPQNYRIKPTYSVSLPRSSPQNQLHIATNTRPNSSPSFVSIPSTSPHLQIKPKYSVSLPPLRPSPQNDIHLATYTQSNSSHPNQNPILYEDAAPNSVQSYISQFTDDSNDNSEVYDVCQEYNITTGNH